MSIPVSPGAKGSRALYRSLAITAILANIIDHLETALYLFLAPVIIRDLLSWSSHGAVFTWSLGLVLGGALRIGLALTWNAIHSKLGSHKILSICLFSVAFFCLLLGLIGLIGQSSSGSWSYLLAASFTLIRALQSLFSMAETHASKSLLMSTAESKHTLASVLASSSSICGTFLASALCLLICLFDPKLLSWPWIYLAAGCCAMMLGFFRKRLKIERLEEAGSKQPVSAFRMALCAIGASFGYASFHWISVFTSPQLMHISQKLEDQTSYLSSQTLLMGSDVLLLLLMGVVAKGLGAKRLLWLSPWICSIVAIGYGLELIDSSLARALVLVPGVASAACYGRWLVELTRPRYLFPYSCLAGAIGSLVAGVILSLSLWMQADHYSLWMQTAPFVAIFLAQALTCTLWNYKKG